MPPGVVGQEGILETNDEELAFPPFIIAREVLDAVYVIMGFDVYNTLGWPLLVDLDHEEVSKEGHGRLDPVASADVWETSQYAVIPWGVLSRKDVEVVEESDEKGRKGDGQHTMD